MPARLLLAHASVLLALVRQAFMAIYKTLTDGIIADEVADQQARTLHTPGSASAATPCTCAIHPLLPNTCRAPRSERRLALTALLAVQTKDAVAWVREMIDYNVPLGKLNRGLAVLDGAWRRGRLAWIGLSCLGLAVFRRSCASQRQGHFGRGVPGHDRGLVH